MIELLKSHPFFADKDITSCILLDQQGYCNENYLVLANDTKFIVRKLLRDDINRVLEWKVLKLAYEQGITTEPLVYDAEQGFMVFDFLDGEHKTTMEEDELKHLVSTLQKLHNIPLDSAPIVLDIKNHTAEVKKAFKTIEQYPKEYVLCHNDLNPQNIFFGHDTKLIDFEYAGVNDRYFDLACVCVEFGLDEKKQEVFLEAYFKDKAYVLEKLLAYKIIYSALCKEWFSSLV